MLRRTRGPNSNKVWHVSSKLPIHGVPIRPRERVLQMLRAE
jgi:hypothetical protein